MVAFMTPQWTNPKAIAQAGESIYKERYQREYEQTSTGKFLAINVISKNAAIGDNPEQALQNAKAQEPDGIFHLIRVGFPSAFQVSYAAQGTYSDWLFG